MHYPGYNYLGPGTDLSKNNKPVNKLDRAAKAHDKKYNSYLKQRASKWDIYTRNSKADNDFIVGAANTPFSIERELATGIFRGKRALNRILGRSPVDSIIKRRKLPKQNNNMRYLLGKRGRTRRPLRKRRFKKRHRSSFFNKVMKVMNPMRQYVAQNFKREIGTLNRRNYVHLSNTALGVALRPPGGSYLICHAISLALSLTDLTLAANWTKSWVFYVSQFYKWKISNNSNVKNRATIYWIKMSGDISLDPLGMIIDPDFYDNTQYFPNNGTEDAVTPDATYTSSPNINSTLAYNPLTDRNLLTNFKNKFRVRRGTSMTFTPGQTKVFSYKKKTTRYAYGDMFDSNLNRYDFPKGTVFPILVWDGDILPGTKTPNDLIGPYTALTSGVNRGDWSWQMDVKMHIQQKIAKEQFLYIDRGTQQTETTAADLTAFGFDNNAAVSAI